MNYTFKSGLKVEGTIEEITNIAKMIGEVLDLSQLSRPKGYYFSESKQQYVKISEMDSLHVRNALCKIIRKYYEDLSKERTISNVDFMKKFVDVTNIEIVQELFENLNKA